MLLAGCAVLKDRLPPPEATDHGIFFRYEDAAAWRVEVAGQFNDWKTFPDERSVQMSKDEKGVWTVVVPYKEFSKNAQVYVEPGRRYLYKIVINGTSWIEDPNNTLKGVEGGQTNSMIIVPEQKTAGK